MSQPSSLESPFSFSAGGRQGKLLNLISSPLENALYLKKCERVCACLAGSRTPAEFMRGVLGQLNVTADVSEKEISRIPISGSAVVVANHPYGAIEGIVLADLLCSCRPDVKILANELLGRISHLREMLFPVNVFNTEGARHGNLRAIRDAIRWVQDGHMLMVFPAGEVSHLKLYRREISDPQWRPSIGKIILKTKAPVVPVFFKGTNGPMFQLAGLLHPRLRTIMLPRELMNKQKRRIELKIGQPIPHKRLARFTDARDALDFLRWRTYLLGHATAGIPIDMNRLPKACRKHPKAIAPPLPSGSLALEVDRLPPGQKLSENGDLTVWEAVSSQIPGLLEELGRLREITFRKANEGTGNTLDLDPFDRYYHHIFIWNQKAGEVVGAYRIGCTDDILSRFGARGLYTSTLFRSSRKFFDAIGPALELGRSFIRPEYQRSYASLLLLWKGIGQFIVRRPRYRMLFGPVSISRDYSEFSRRLIAATLLNHSQARELAAMIRPKSPPKMKPVRLPGLHQQDTLRFCSDMDDVCSVLADIELEASGIPVLLRHYLNLGGQLLSFNVDKKFGNCLDGLILVDLLQSPPKSLRRYFGKEGLESYYRFHRHGKSEAALFSKAG
jgi:putative hemolysin